MKITPRLNDRCLFNQRTFAGTKELTPTGDERRWRTFPRLATERGGSTLSVITANPTSGRDRPVALIAGEDRTTRKLGPGT